MDLAKLAGVSEEWVGESPITLYYSLNDINKYYLFNDIIVIVIIVIIARSPINENMQREM